MRTIRPASTTPLAAQLQHLLAAGQRKHRRLLKRGAAPCLLAAQACEPHAIPGHRLEQRFNFAQAAAAVRTV